MPASEILQLTRQFQADLDAKDSQVTQDLARRWLQVEQELQQDILDLATELSEMAGQGQVIKQWRLNKLRRYTRLLAQLQEQLQSFNAQAAVDIAWLQNQAAFAGIQNALTYINEVAAFYDAQSVVIQMDRLGSEAVQNIVAVARGGGPLDRLLQNAYPATANAITNKLIFNTAMGRNPRQTAREIIRDGLATGLNHVLLVARDQQIRAYREATRQQYERSGVVEAYRRLCAKNSRTCFLAGTRIQTSNGDVCIEDIKPGDSVWTNKDRLALVTETLSQNYTGPIVTIRTESGREIVCTEDHPVLVERQGKLDWIFAGEAISGDRVISRFKGRAQSINHFARHISIKRCIGQANDSIALGRQAQVFTPIGIGPLVPVNSVNFKSNVEIRQKEVNRVTINRGFLDEAKSHQFQRFADVPFWLCFALIFSVTSWAAKFLIRHSRNYTELFSALLARIYDRWPTAKLRAVFSISAGTTGMGLKLFATNFANAVDLIPLKNPPTFPATAEPRRVSAIIANVRWPSFKNFTTYWTSQLNFVSHNIKSLFLSNSQKPYIYKYDTIFSVEKQLYNSVVVYNLEVEEDHTYFANDILVHNCLACLALDGTIWPTSELMPLHPQDRCSQIPIVNGLPPIRSQTGRDWFMNQPAETQKRMMGKGVYEAWQDGKFDFRQLATIKEHPVWGPSARVTSLRDLLAGKGGLQ